MSIYGTTPGRMDAFILIQQPIGRKPGVSFKEVGMGNLHFKNN